MATTQLLHLKNISLNHNHDLIAGIDEAGRGSLAGPVVTSAVILSPKINTIKIKDSKILSSKKRKVLYNYIIKNTLYISTSIISHHEIDSLNILKATMKGMKIALMELKQKPSLVLIDGNQKPTIKNYNIKTIVKGDKIEKVISAASIIAKVTRDNIMDNYSKLYTNYGFDKNKGYGTEKHYNQLFKYGPSPIHRKSFKLQKQLKLL